MKTIQIDARQLRWLQRVFTRPSSEMSKFFDAEMANEQNGGYAPSNLWSAMDSLMQYPEELVEEHYCIHKDKLMTELKTLTTVFGKQKQLLELTN